MSYTDDFGDLGPAIVRLESILRETTEYEDGVCYVTSDDADALETAIRSLHQWAHLIENIKDLSMSCAFDMPSFWYNKGKDYKVIPTRYHKGYQQALADIKKEIVELVYTIGHRAG